MSKKTFSNFGLFLFGALLFAAGTNAAFAQPTASIPAGHAAGITKLTFSPDGKTLLSASRDRTIKLWDVAGRRIRFSTPAHRSEIVDADFAPDGAVFAGLEGISSKVTIRSTADGRFLREVPIDSVGIYTALKFSPDGEHLALGTMSGKIQFFSTRSWKLVFAVSAPKNAPESHIYDIDFSPDGKTMAAAAGVSIYAWNLSTKKPLWTLPISMVNGLLANKTASKWKQIEFSADGKSIFCASDGEIRRVDAQTGATVKSINRFMYALEVPSAGGLVAVSGASLRRLVLFDSQTLEFVREIPAGASGGDPIAISSDGESVAAVIDSKTIKIWNTADGKEVAAFGYKGYAANAVWTPDGAQILVINEFIKSFDAQTGQLLKTYEGSSCIPDDLVVSPDGGFLVGTVQLTIKERCRTKPAAETSDTHGREALYYWNLKTGELVYAAANKQSLAAPSFSPDGKYIAAGMDNAVAIRQARDGRPVREIPTGEGSQTSYTAFSADGQQISAVVVNNLEKATKRTWPAAGGTSSENPALPADVYGFTPANRSFAVSTDGATLAFSRPLERNAELWNFIKGKTEIVLKADSPATKFAFSFDGKLLATAHDDWKIRIWETPTGKLLATLSGHDYQISALTFSPNGEKLLSVGSNGIVYIWNAKTGAAEKSIFTGTRAQ